MYFDHFGLKQAPFKITPNTEFFFSGANRGPVLEALIYAITHGEGIVKVTGEVGSGKTMLCNMLQNRLPDNVESVYLANPSVAPEEVLHAIAFDLQLGVDREADRLEVMHILQDHLLSRYAQGQRVVVFIEESQSMPLATLEEIRLLSNLETRSDKLLQIVLFGQPELDVNLRRPNIRQLRDRIAHSFRLEPLTDEEVREYLMFRMRAAGYRGPEIFKPAVVRQIAKASSGLTRRVNLVADKTLLAAFAENTHTIESRHVRAALRDSEFSPSPRRHASRSPALALASLSLAIGVGLGAGLYAVFDARSDRRGGAASVALPVTESLATRTPGAAPGSASAPEPYATAPSMAPAPPAAPIAADASLSASAPVSASGAMLSSAPADEGSRRSAELPVATAGNFAPVVSAQAATRQAGILTTPTATASADLIASRIEATRGWLKTAARHAYSIQIMASDDMEQLRNHLTNLPKFIELDDIYLYRAMGSEKPVVNVLYGSFATREQAQAELAELPAALHANRPYVRAIDGLRAQTDRQSEPRRR